MSFKLKIFYEDNHVLVVEKPANIPVQEDVTKDEDFLSILKSDLKQRHNKPGNVFLGLVHRLDRPVGGIMVFAKTSKSASRLSEQIRNRSFKKTYLAILKGKIKQKIGQLNDYLYKDTKNNIVHVVDENFKDAKLAQLKYETLAQCDNFSLVKIDLLTGRPHQIRVQFANIGHPLAGDVKYGNNGNKEIENICLHSYKIGFEHPTKHEWIEFSSQPPPRYPWHSFQEKI